MRLFWRCLKWTLLALLVAVLVFVGVNAFDETLRPEVRAALEPVPDPQPPESNMLYAVIGFDAAGDDIARVGLARRREADRRMEANPDGDLSFPRERDGLAFEGDETLVKHPDERFERVLTTARQRPADTGALLAANARLMARYRSLRAYPQLVGSLTPGLRAPLPPWQQLLAARRVWRLWLADRIQRGQVDEAVRDLRDDTLAWRRLLGLPHVHLVDKMILATWVRTDFESASVLLRAARLSASQRAVLAQTAGALTPQERSLAGPIGIEFRNQASMLREVHPTNTLADRRLESREPDDTGLRRRAVRRVAMLGGNLLFKLDASLNRQHGVVRQAIEIDAHDCRRHHEDGPAVAAAGRFPDWWTLGYNPMGKILLAVGTPSFHTYSGRMCDLAGFQRLLALQLHLHEQGITPQTPQPQIEAAIAQAGAAYADPYTGGPMLWSPQARGMAFGAADDRSRKMLPWPL